MARRLLDPRAVFIGVWIQENVRVYGSESAEQGHNRFAVFTVDYRKAADSYAVDGRAYSQQGKEYARFSSVDALHFAEDGRSMTYVFEGTITTPVFGGDPNRTGLSRIALSSDDAGRGRVEHVAMNISLIYDIRRVTKRWLASKDLTGFEPEKLREPDIQREFAAAFARQVRQAVAG
jgi:hypothetical protein